MKKLSGILVLALLIGILALSGCGAPEPSPYDGRWIAVGAEAYGIQMPIGDLVSGEGFIIEVLGVGKAKIIVDGKESNQKWSGEGDQFILNIDGTETTGTVKGDVIAFENMLDTGATMFFAKEGTESANPELYNNTDELLQDFAENGGEIKYLPVQEDTLIGTWVSMGYSMAVEDPVEHDPELIGLSDIAQLMEVTFNEDKTMHLSFNNAAAVNDYNWHIEGNMMVIESGDIQYEIYYRSDGLIEVIFTNPESYMEIYCEKK